MHAFITAGGIPAPDDPLYPYSQGKPKALIEVAGQPMIQWVLDALSGARHVDSVLIVGLEPQPHLTCAKPLHYEPDHGSLLENVLAGMHRLQALYPEARHGLHVSADIPAITPEMVDWRIEVAGEDPGDFDYVAVERSVMEARFPTANRSYLRLKDVEVCGGDVNILRLGLTGDVALWERIIEARKSPLRQAALVGYSTLLLILLRRLTLRQAEARVARQLGIRGQVHLSPYAEIAMDVDKPHQLEILRQELAARDGAKA